MQKHTQFIKVANSCLDTLLLNNDPKLFDLPYKWEALSNSIWKIEDNIETKLYNIRVNRLKTNLIKESDVVATYTVYLDENSEFVDEFFITLPLLPLLP